MAQDVAAIAKGLTEAMTRELLRSYPLSAALADWRSFPALKRRGLIEVTERGLLDITPLGLAVRQHLQECGK